MDVTDSDKMPWVEQLPRGKPAKDSLARLIEVAHDEAEVSYYEAVADPTYVAVERQRRRYREMFRRRLRHLRGNGNAN